MKTIGLIGGMSWESTSIYYRIINEEVKKRLGGLHSAKCILYSVDFAEIELYQRNGDWDLAGSQLANAALSLEKAGADCIVICTNTMHKVVSTIEQAITIPVIHIADATAEEILSKEIRTVALLGTKYTMEEDFYKSRIEDKGIRVLIPNEEEREEVNRIIFEELCLGEVSEKSRAFYEGVITRIGREGAEGIILGCTEIGMLVKKENAEIPVFDTTYIHAVSAVTKALQAKDNRGD